MPKRSTGGLPGRPKHDMWSLGFRRVMKHCEKTQRTSNAAFCTYCNKVLCNTAAKRLQSHRKLCHSESNSSTVIQDTDTNVEPKKEYIKLPGQEDDDINAVVATDIVTFIDSESSDNFIAIPSSSKDIKCLEITSVTSHAPQEKSEIAIAKFFIGSNIPFSIADTNYFKTMCLTLKPDLKPVSCTALEGPILDTLYSKFINLTLGPSSVLLVDSWKNEISGFNNVSISILSITNEVVFLDNYEIPNTTDIAQELTNIITLSILEAFDNHKTEIYAVITGGSINLMNFSLNANTWHFICSAQVLKLLIKEVIEQEPIDIIYKILKQYCVCSKISVNLMGIIDKNLHWSHYRDIIDYFLNNISEIQSLFSTGEKLPKEIQDLIFNEDFIRKIEKFFHFLDAVNELVQISISELSNIADVTEQWLSLQITENISDFENKLVSCREQVINVQSLVANYLHPVYKGRNLTEEHMSKVEDFLLNELGPDGLNSLQAYIDGTGIFKILNEKTGVAPQTYWKLAKRHHSELSTLSLKFLAIPCSVISNFTEISDSLSNYNLKPEALKKLLAIKLHLNKIESETNIDEL